MTVDTIAPVQGPARIGQATAVEQSRAVAEVAAAVQVAQACPRSIERARAEMRRSCAEYDMACRAFFRYRRGGQEVTGPTVALARELKRCFGNFQSGMGELRRDDAAGQSEMQAWAWDVETNARSATVFIVPHENYMTGKPLDALRDVYENNANQGARREREMILGLLPTWYVEEAIRACRDAIERGPAGEPLTVRQDKAAAALLTLGVSLDRVERKIGRSKAQWTPQDLADLTVDYHSIRRGELSADERFPAERLTVDDVAPAPQQAAEVPAGQHVDPSTGVHLPTVPKPLEEGTWRRINAKFVELGVKGAGQTERRLYAISHLVGRTIARGGELTEGEGQRVLANLDPKLIEELYPPQQPERPAEPQAETPEGLAEAAADEYDPTADDSWPMDGAEAAAEGM